MTPSPPKAWDSALAIVRALRAKGHVALLAGGCVRDRLLGVEPNDYDVATDATPARVAEIFPRARHVGAKFGVMIVRKRGHDIEVATFRSDGTYSDGRHPDGVVFGSDEQDALRRDFTVNGLFLDPIQDRVIDYVKGRADLEAGVIRTIGDPGKRFAEDHLRMLRAVRFAARLGFEIEVDTFSAIQRLADRLGAISAERICLELKAILTAPSRATGWKLLLDSGLRSHLSAAWVLDDQEELLNLRRLAALPGRPVAASLGLAAVLCARKPEEVSVICRSLKVSNRLNDAVTWLVRSLPLVHEERALEPADLKLLMARDDWSELLELLRSDLTASGRDSASHSSLCERAAAVRVADVSPPPLLTGDDLLRIGVTPGPRFGKLLETVYRAQLNEEIATREQALALARAKLESGA